MAVVPQGGNTGLVGGSVPVFDEVIIYNLCFDIAEAIFCISGAQFIYMSFVRTVCWQVIVNLGAMNKIIEFDEVR